MLYITGIFFQMLEMKEVTYRENTVRCNFIGLNKYYIKYLYNKIDNFFIKWCIILYPFWACKYPLNRSIADSVMKGTKCCLLTKLLLLFLIGQLRCITKNFGPPELFKLRSFIGLLMRDVRVQLIGLSIIFVWYPDHKGRFSVLNPESKKLLLGSPKTNIWTGTSFTPNNLPAVYV